jgi:small subunit ribosomal protein S15
MLSKEKKEKIIKKFRIHPNDTGSSNIQVAILTEEIKQLTEHLKNHKKDFSSRRGLIMKINERRKLLKYLLKSDPVSYKKLVKKLGIKPTFEALQMAERRIAELDDRELPENSQDDHSKKQTKDTTAKT